MAAMRDLGGFGVDAIMTAVIEVLAATSPELLAAVRGLLLGGAQEGIATAGRRLPFEGASLDWTLADEKAAAWVDSYSFDLIKGINETSAGRMRGALRTWIDDGGALEDLVDSIRPIFDDDELARRIELIFNVERARLIAETEATRAYAQGKIAGYTSSGLADLPPAVSPPDDSHPRCRCDVSLEKRDGVWVWIWYTARDDLTCNICRPLHNQIVGYAFQEDAP